MPMQLTITRNRKTSQNYNSEGYGVSLTVELDQGLLNHPDELQSKISELYREADAALDQQVGVHPTQLPSQPRTERYPRNGNGNGHSNGNGRRPSPSNGRNGSQMTTAQRRAIDTISQRLNIDESISEHPRAQGARG